MGRSFIDAELTDGSDDHWSEPHNNDQNRMNNEQNLDIPLCSKVMMI